MLIKTPRRLQQRLARSSIALVVALGTAGTTLADGSGGSDLGLETITIVATGVSNMAAASAGDVSQEQIAAQPLLRILAYLVPCA